MDTITILKSAGPKLTKTFDGDQVRPYDQAKQFQVSEPEVRNIRELADTLRDLEKKVTCCVIRGKFVGDEKASGLAPQDKPGYWPRLNPLFDEVPHHWVMFDIDRYWPVIYDEPAKMPAEAIEEFIQDKLPECFQGISFHWQLSSSAGMKDPRCLKAHVWFWLDRAYTGSQIEAWIRANKLPIDVAPMRQVQVHYTANPVFTNGAVDPVPVRSGLVEGFLGDSAWLEIPEDVLAGVDSHENVAGDDLDLTDPTTKPGLIGAFCRAYPISRVLGELLADEFEYAVGNDRRVTWFNSGSGSPEGCFVREDDLYFGNTHHTDPFENRLTNAWDLVRYFKFGHLDGDLAKDPLVSVNELPSHRAMLAWVETLDDVRDEQVAVATDARDLAVADIRACESENQLRQRVLPEVMRQKGLMTKPDLDILVLEVQAKLRRFTGTRVSIAIARGVLREAERAIREGDVEPVDRSQAPFWAQPWVYVTNGDFFFNQDTKEIQTKQGFDFAFQRFMGPFMDEEGRVPRPSEMAASLWAMDVVADIAYNPTLARTFEMEGRQYVNTYSTLCIPDVPPVLTSSEEAFLQLLDGHAARLLPDERERTLFLDWLAFNVQHPGVKIRWSPFMYGVPGAGKTIWHSVLMAAMGPSNVVTVSAETLIGSGFNEWANQGAVVVIEEIKVPDHSARETENKLKPLVTNPVISIHPKGRKQYRVVNVSNYLLFSNFADGLPITKSDRRYMALSAAVTEEESVELADSGYFQDLFGGLERFPGAVRKWLLERKLSPGFNPDGHAPFTAAKALAIELSKSDTNMALEEVIESGTKGVTRDYISSPHLALAIQESTGKEVYTSTLHKMLTAAGYHLYGRIKWDGANRRVWTRVCLGPTSPDLNRQVREGLDMSIGADFDFLE